MNKKNKTLTVTVGIPTCYGGESLLATAKSLRGSIGVQKFRFIICADRNPIAPPILKQLQKMNIEVYWNAVEGSQFKKLNQIIQKVDSDLFIFTQDDITFEPKTLKHIVQAFEWNENLTMLGARVLPLMPNGFFEAVLATMIRLNDFVGRAWNEGDNHLMASGRCLAFRTSFLKKFRIPERVVNGDMYLYLENKRLNGSFRYSKRGIVHIRAPQTMKDQIGPSSRYQYSQTELKHYFDFDISNEYKIPVHAIIKGFLNELFMHPLRTICYIGVFIYTRLKKQSTNIVSNPVWKVDPSTKNIAS